MKGKFILLWLLIPFFACGTPQSKLQKRLEKMVNDFPGDVGIALIATKIPFL